jgi:hypothetical protein
MRRPLAALPALALVLASACAEPAGERLAGPASSALFGPKAVVCPTNTTLSETGEVGVLGGVVGVGGTSISIPAGALLDAKAFTVTVPAGNTMAVQIRASGYEHFGFELPVTVTVDYSRCSRSDLARTPLSVWYVDDATGTFLELMPSVDNKLTRTVTFTTGHLSSYVVAE